MIDKLLVWLWQLILKASAAGTKASPPKPAFCGKRCQLLGFVCTREGDHPGPHVAMSPYAARCLHDEASDVHWCGFNLPLAAIEALNNAMTIGLEVELEDQLEKLRS